MRTLINSKMAFLFILIGLSFSCKKNEPVPAENNTVDTTETIVDTVAPIDTTNVLKDSTVVKDTIRTTKK
jgi:hypothetical protein